MIAPELLSAYQNRLAAYDLRGAADSLWPLIESFPPASPERQHLLFLLQDVESANVIMSWTASSGSNNRTSFESAKKAALLSLADDPSCFMSATALLDITLMCGDPSEVASSLVIAEPLMPIAQNVGNSRGDIACSGRFMLFFSLACLVCGRAADAEKAFSLLPSDSEYRSGHYFQLLERFAVQPTPQMRPNQA